MEKPFLPNALAESEATKRWWNALDFVPGRDEWTQADWLFALDTALLVKAVWDDGELKFMQELRQREQALGITPAARPSNKTVEAVIEKVTETPLQRITERRIERRQHGTRKSNTDVPANA